MQSSIAFAKWFIHKHKSSGIFCDSNDLDFVISQLDQSSWDEFIASHANYSSVSLITQLVEKMPNKPRAKKSSDTGAKGKKTRVDAQTSTDDQPIAEHTSKEIPLNLVAEEPVKVVAVEEKVVKKRVTKAKKLDNVDQPLNLVVEEPVKEIPLNLVAEEPVKVVAVEEKVVKKRVTKAKKSDIVDQPLNLVVEEPVKVVAVVAEVVDELVEEPVINRGPKNRKGKDTPHPPDDIVTPNSISSFELSHFDNHDTHILTEIFVNDVLFYLDSDGQWFDLSLNPIHNPTL